MFELFLSYFPEQHHSVIPVNNPVMVEIKAGNRLVVLDPVGVPEKDNGIVPVGETVGVQIVIETVAIWIGGGIGKAREWENIDSASD